MDYHYHSSNPTITHSNIETADVLKSIDLYEFLGVSEQNFCCLFHDDRNPSAHIVQSERGMYYYTCFSPNCLGLRSISIIDVVMLLANIDQVAATEFLCSVYNIHQGVYDIVEGERDALNNNIRCLDNLPPESRLQRFRSELLELNRFALQNCNTTTIGLGDEHVFFVSIHYYAELCRKSDQSAFRHICLFAFIGLIRKMHPDEASPQMQSRRPVHQSRRWTGLFHIPRYSEESLHLAEECLRDWSRAGGTMLGLSYEFMLLVHGEEIARHLFPQTHQVGLSRRIEDFYLRYRACAGQLLRQNGYVLEGQILQNLGPYVNKQVLSKRVITHLAMELRLERITANRELKERYGIQSRGHPYIFVPIDRDQ